MGSSIIKNVKIALFDADMIFCRSVRQQLAAFDMQVDAFHTHEALQTAITAATPDLILLGGCPTGSDSCDDCLNLRVAGPAPLIVLGSKDCSKTASRCLEAGADDYVSKPCDPEELAARIRAVIRRHLAVPSPRPASHPSLHYRQSFGDLSIDVMTGMIDGELALQQLSDTEAALMLELIAAAPGTVCRERLSRSALRRPWAVGDRTVDVLIGRLRKKLTQATHAVSLITVRGGGYALRASPAKASQVEEAGTSRQPA